MKNKKSKADRTPINAKYSERRALLTEGELQERELMEQTCKLKKFFEYFKKRERNKRNGREKLSYASLINESAAAARLCEKLSKKLLDIMKWREVIGEGNYLAETRPLIIQAEAFVETYKFFLRHDHKKAG
ncbi:MAG: hypothetical protein MUF02_00620 [Acidobacteria bacterium]|nr:hypothetical protein [Acidobacteriota bacterium]